MRGISASRLHVGSLDAGDAPADGSALTSDERAELVQLRREVQQLREERDILKKATAFFAKHHA